MIVGAHDERAYVYRRDPGGWTLEAELTSPAPSEGDAFGVEVALDEPGRASLLFRQRLLRGDELLSTARVKVVCLTIDTFRPVAIPGPVREAIHAQQ